MVNAARQDIADRMAEAALFWVDSLDGRQRRTAVGAVPADEASDSERRRWFYTPTDHGGLTMHQQRPAQQRGAMRLVATGFSAAGLGDADHAAVEYTVQRELLRALLRTYVDRVPLGARRTWDDAALDAVHVAWAGSLEPGAPHYYRLQGTRLLAEWDNTQRDANHAHSVWRDPTSDFGLDVLGAHRSMHH